jgi:hypothetical protein
MRGGQVLPTRHTFTVNFVQIRRFKISLQLFNQLLSNFRLHRVIASFNGFWIYFAWIQKFDLYKLDKT